MYYTYKNSIFIGTIGGMIAGAFFAGVKSYLEKTTINNFRAKITHNIQYLQDNIQRNLLNCPKSNFHLKYYLNEYNHLVSLPFKQQDYHLKKMLEHSICNGYRKLITPTTISSTQIIEEAKKVFELINSKVNKNSYNTLLILGESHLSPESFLLENLILTYLKRHNLSNNFLIERSPNYDQSTPLNKFQDINPIHFAQHILGYNLLGIDPYNENEEVEAFSSKREIAMGESILNHLKDSNDMVTVASVGMLHLTFFKDNINAMKTAKNSNILLIKLGKYSALFNEEDELVQNRLSKLDSIDGIELNISLEAMSFKQILEIYVDCLENDFNGKDNLYSSKDYLQCPDRINYSQISFCGAQTEEGIING